MMGLIETSMMGEKNMLVKQPKKMLIVNILEILKKYSDENHRLTQSDFVRILKDEYQMDVDRKAIKRNLMNLVESGYNIEFEKAIRINKFNEEEELYINWYLEKDFSDAELRLLIDSVLFSKHIPQKQVKELIDKIKKLSSKYFKVSVSNILNLPENTIRNKELFYTIEVLDEAIDKGKQIEFIYNNFDINKKLKPRLNDKGEIRKYIINPYQMVATNGRYYLIANYDKYDDVSHYRIDRITNIKILNSNVKPKNKVKGLEKGLNVSKHMAEHIYMFSGSSEIVYFKANKDIFGEIIDWFGDGVYFSDETEDEVTVKVKVNLIAMKYWALQYVNNVEILSPESLIEDIKKELRVGIEKYGLL